MTTSLFDVAAEVLETRTDFDRLEARGTLRIALKSAGLDAKRVTFAQLCVAFEKVLPAELELRGVDDPAKVVSDAMREIATATAGAAFASSSDEVIGRLGGDKPNLLATGHH